MTASILAIRPEPGLASTLSAGLEAGLSIKGFPLFQVEPISWTVPQDGDFDALLVGSANAFRHGGDQLTKLRHIPVLAVGEATAAAACSAGFGVEETGKGGLQTLVDAHRGGPVRWLRLAGEEHVELDIPFHITIETRTTYRVQTVDLPEELRADLRCECVVLLHSAAAARHFAFSCDAHHIDRSRIALAALGPRILEAVGDGWLDMRAATQPSESALMALAKEMCETI